MAVVTEPVRAAPDVDRAVAAGGAILVGTAAGLIAVLHVVAPELPPLWSMISDYALGPYRPLFDVAVLTLAAGSGAVLLALIRTGLLRGSSGSVALLATWCVAMPVVVAFPTCYCRTEVTTAGVVHAVASLTGFLTLPLAALRMGSRWCDHPLWWRHAACVRVLGVVALGWLAPMLLGVVPVAALTGPLWAVVPFGLVERGLAVVEVAVLLVLSAWAARAAAVPQPVLSQPVLSQPDPPGSSCRA